MTTWKRLSQYEVSSWLADVMSAPAAPSYELEPRSYPPKSWKSAGASWSSRWDDRSGIMLVDAFGTSAQAARSAIIAMANDSDVRELVEIDATEMRTKIDGIDVIGPGGRVLIFGRGDSFRAEFVLRHRTAPRYGSWRSAAAIIAQLEETVANASSVTIDAAFGYFEASRYVRQTLLRPAVVFALSSANEVAPWAEHLVIAATEGDSDGEVEDGMTFTACA